MTDLTLQAEAHSRQQYAWRIHWRQRQRTSKCWRLSININAVQFNFILRKRLDIWDDFEDMWKLVRYSLHWSSYVAFWVEIKFQEISGILKANNSVDNLCRWVLVHFHFIIMAFNQSQQFNGLFSIFDPIGHKQAKNVTLQETPV